MSEPRDQFVDAQGLPIHCLEWGERTGQALLLVHGYLDLAYKGNKRGIFDDVTVEHGLWLAGLLNQLSDRQISDAFRAARYSPSEIRAMTRAVRSRIEQLGRPGPAMTARGSRRRPR